MLLPRHATRVGFLWAKLAACMVATAAFVLGTLLVAALGSTLGCWIANIPQGPMTHQDQIVSLVTLSLLSMLYLSALAASGALLTRSTLGGVLTAFGGSTLLSLLKMGWEPLAYVVPGMHVENLSLLWIPPELPPAIPLFETPVSASASVAIIVGFSVVVFAVGWWEAWASWMWRKWEKQTKH